MHAVAKARIAGFAYLVIIFAAIFAEMIVRNGAFDRGDVAWRCRSAV